jgi:hypothetical protein
VELPFRIKFSLSRKLSGYDFPAISKQRDVSRHCKKREENSQNRKNMDYLFETLGDERFQEFCSCLISKEFANIQVFPVGQPDGGRDSLVYTMNTPTKEFYVFQVKYVRNAMIERDIHKWLTETIDGEVEKINKLIPKGATKYFLLTNVKGTAHLDSGSIDKINKILESKISIPSICWWREDLSILFEKDPLFKWSFPQILNGQDVLNSVLFNSINEHKSRRENVIRAYLVDQYEIDNEVKFKQIDLQNRLLELFTDVPIRTKKINTKNKLLRNSLNLLGQNFGNEEYFIVDDFNINTSNNWTAAEFILHPKVQSEISRILLEGGPGQGKSTISQFICQVHRVRLLEITKDIDLLKKSIVETPIRLPFKIDLRDVASWLEKKNPYQGSITDDFFNNNWQKSLESFLISHIFYHSKQNEFTTNDFTEVSKLSPILLVFDGFDEIANLKLRSEVIEFINMGITRLSANSKAIQVIITSRPSAFSDSVGFSIDSYPHFELTDITPQIINEYVEKWIKSSKLGIRDANDLKKLINEKLEMPHLKDLAKSPMQLAIFISLLRTKGQSLPNKRTALYDSYIELFFDRESEKNYLIRDKRDLIIDIHQYLAWILHSEAEMLKNNGSIHYEKLNLLLKEYLKNEGHNTEIADQLFDVMKERVCALVSRVQGTFEFEVQPLREYFCAKYLYKSAPHSSAGSIKKGTKPERFQAILKNFYWQNVVRFFAGCADAGELDMLIEELKDLQNDEFLKYTNYPRIITSQILSDYVFTQKPKKLNDVVKIIIDGVNIGNIINQSNRSNEPLVLPNECGRQELVLECFNQLILFPKNDYTLELISIIKNNPIENLIKWTELSTAFKDDKLTKWLEYGYKIELIYKIPESQLIALLEEGNELETKKRLQIILNGNRAEIIDKNLKYKQIVLDSIFNLDISAIKTANKLDSLNFISLILHPYILSNILRFEGEKQTFISHYNRYIQNRRSIETSISLISEFEIKDEIDEKIDDFKNTISVLFDMPLIEFKSNINLWDILIESIRKQVKNSRIPIIASIIAAGIKSTDKISEDFRQLNDESKSLCKRVRYARLKSGNIKYWEQELKSTSNINFILLVFFNWATPKTIMALLPILNELIKSFNQVEYNNFIKDMSNIPSIPKFNKKQQSEIEIALKEGKSSEEIQYILSQRFENSNKEKFIYNNITKNTGVFKKIEEIKFEYLVNKFLINPKEESLLYEIRDMYKNICFYNERHYYGYESNEGSKIPLNIAKIIMENCKDYPKLISSIAEKKCRQYSNENLKPIGEIAKRENWFESN